jgi:Ca2+-binding RTX toxin-like protein
VWEVILQASEAIASTYIPYGAFLNSNTFVNTLLNAVGIDLSAYLPGITPPAVEAGFPGVGVDAASSFGSSMLYADIKYHITGTIGADLFQGGDHDDYIGGGEGNDVLRDGGGEDIMEGGKGDDIVQLDDDSESDIIIVGQGQDTILGSNTDDRLVFRADLFNLAPDAEGLGSAAATSGIPLLGGFVIYEDGGHREAFYTPFRQYAVDVPPSQEYLDSQPEIPWHITHIETQYFDCGWPEFTAVGEDNGYEYGVQSFYIDYSLDGGTMTINITYDINNDDVDGMIASRAMIPSTREQATMWSLARRELETTLTRAAMVSTPSCTARRRLLFLSTSSRVRQAEMKSAPTSCRISRTSSAGAATISCSVMKTII